MPRPKPPRFRPTELVLWPGDPGALDELIYHGPITLDGDELVMAEGGDGSTTPVPEDFVLREVLDVDVFDAESVRAFVETWGPSSKVLGGEGVARFRVRLEAGRLLTLQVLVRHWLRFQAGRPVVDAWLEHGGDTLLEQRRREVFLRDLEPERLAWSLWMREVNNALKSWHMHLAATFAGEAHPELGDLDWQRMFITPYQVGVRQLAEMASRGAVVQHCANANCGRPFTRQRGRAQYAARERGVKYCSHSCAKAQSERERRARRRESRS